MSGWFVMHRGWMDSFKPEPFTEREAFLWSIEQAAFQEHDQWFNGHRITVARGEFVTSLRDMEKAFGWSLKRIRGFMDRMGKAQKWAHRRAYDGAQSPTIISVCNYDAYQSVSDAGGTVEGTAKGTRRAQSGHSKGTQQKEGNKGNKAEDRPSVSSPGADDLAETAVPRSRSLALVPAVDVVRCAFDDFELMRRSINPAARPAEFTDDRRKKLAARLSDIGGPEAWREVLAIITASRFLRGETSQNGSLVANIDWLLKPQNLRKVREGNYDDRRPANASREPAVRNSPIDALGAAIAASGLG